MMVRGMEKPGFRREEHPLSLWIIKWGLSLSFFPRKGCKE